jgi:glutamate-ammonia-ligase adenylyltransferase
MALTRARTIAGDPDLGARIDAAIRDTLRAPRDPDALLIDVLEMRERIERERPAKTIWSVKFLRGGLTDLEFLAQYLLLRHAAAHPEIIDGATHKVFAKLADAGLLEVGRAQMLIDATRLIRQIQGMLRLTAAPAFDADQGSPSLKSALARAAGLDDFDTLRRHLIETAQTVHEIFIETIETPAREAIARRDGQEAEGSSS